MFIPESSGPSSHSFTHNVLVPMVTTNANRWIMSHPSSLVLWKPLLTTTTSAALCDESTSSGAPLQPVLGPGPEQQIGMSTFWICFSRWFPVRCFLELPPECWCVRSYSSDRLFANMLPVIFSLLLTELLDVVGDQLSAAVLLSTFAPWLTDSSDKPLRGKKWDGRTAERGRCIVWAVLLSALPVGGSRAPQSFSLWPETLRQAVKG